MATLPISRGPSSRTVSRSTSPTPGQPLTSEFVGVAEQLVAAADGEDHLSGGRRGVQRVALDRGQILGAQHLVAVLAAADVEEVVGVRVERVAEAGAGELEADPAPLAALAQQRAGCRGRRRCSSGPDTARRRAGRQPRKTTTWAGDVLGRLGDVAQLLGLQPVLGGLLGQPAGGDDLQADHVVERLALAVGADQLADPLDRTWLLVARGSRSAGRCRSSRRPGPGPGRGSGGCAVVGLEVGRDRDRDAPARHDRAPGGGEEARRARAAAGSSASARRPARRGAGA